MSFARITNLVLICLFSELLLKLFGIAPWQKLENSPRFSPQIFYKGPRFSPQKFTKASMSVHFSSKFT